VRARPGTTALSWLSGSDRTVPGAECFLRFRSRSCDDKPDPSRGSGKSQQRKRLVTPGAARPETFGHQREHCQAVVGLGDRTGLDSEHSRCENELVVVLGLLVDRSDERRRVVGERGFDLRSLVH
jgi:hypothetical protein